MSATKSASITNLDTIPAAANTAGEGAPDRLKIINDYLTAPVTTGNYATDARVLRFVRIPSNAVVKEVTLESAAQTQGTYDIGLFYSSSTVDGTTVGNQGLVLDADFFASAVSCASAVPRTDETAEAGTYTMAKRNQPIWQAAGLSSDPGGFFDVAATATNTVTVGGVMSVEVKFAH